MYDEEVTKAAHRRQKAIKMMNELEESDEITTLITKLNYWPKQSPEKRYEYVKISRKEGKGGKICLRNF